MNIQPDHVYQFSDKFGRRLGSILVSDIANERYNGILTEGPDFEVVRDLFQRQDEAIEGQMLGIWDDVNREIETLSPSVLLGETDSLRIFDLHVKEGHLVSFLISPFRPTVRKEK